MDLTPDYEIIAAGRDWAPEIRRALIELRVESTTDRTSDSVEIVLGDEAGAVAAPPTGQLLAVRIGYAESGLADAGEYWHSETELEFAPRRVTIRGVAADITAASAMKAPRARAWHDTTVEAIVRAIAAEHGLEALVDAAFAAATIAHLDQTDSDLHLLRRLAADHDASAQMAGRRLVFARAATPAAHSGQPVPETPLTPDTPYTSARVVYRGRPRYGAVRAGWIDYDGARIVTETAGDGSPSLDLADPYPTRAQAAAAAHGALLQHARSGATLDLDVPGEPHTWAGGVIVVRDRDPLADGRWTITRATHSITPTGYTTTISAAPEVPGMAA